MTHERLVEAMKPTLDTISLGTVVATIVGALPEISAFLSIVWVAIRIYETDTIQRLLKRKP